MRPWKRRKESKESKECKGFHQGERERAVWRKSGVWRWTTRMRQGVDDEQKKKLQKELRDIEKLSCLNSCRKWNTGGTISCKSIRKCRTNRQIMEGSRTICRKTVPQQKRRCRSFRGA